MGVYVLKSSRTASWIIDRYTRYLKCDSCGTKWTQHEYEPVHECPACVLQDNKKRDPDIGSTFFQGGKL